MLLKPIYKIEREKNPPRPPYGACLTLQKLDRETRKRQPQASIFDKHSCKTSSKYSQIEVNNTLK